MNVHTQFNQIYDQTFDRLRRFVYPRVRSQEDLSDLIQETYLELFRMLQRGIEPKQPEAVVIHVAKQKLARYYADLARAPVPIAEPPEYAETLALDRWVDEELADATDVRRLSEAIRSELPTEPWPIRQIFTCIFALDMKMPEVADHLGLTVNQVRNLYYRTLKDLRTRYAAPSHAPYRQKETSL